MEAWALVDLATALDESSVPRVISRTVSGPHENKSFDDSNPLLAVQTTRGKNSCRRRTKSTGNLIDQAAGSSLSSGAEMDEPHEPLTNSQQARADDSFTESPRNAGGSHPGPLFAIPLPQQQQPAQQISPCSTVHSGLNSVAFNVVRLATQPLSVAESDSLNETVSPMRPHTRRKRRFKRMAVDPEPVMIQQQQHQGASLDIEDSSCNNNNTISPATGVIHPAGFSFSTFASSSIFAKPRQRKANRKKPINIQKLSDVMIGKRKRSVRERSIECELEKISLNSSPEEGGADACLGAGRVSVGGSSGGSGAHRCIGVDGDVHGGHSNMRHHGHHPGAGHLLMMNGDPMDLDMKQHEQVSSSSVSGSESDPGGYGYGDYGYDEDGREADDEQSDWYPENGPTWGTVNIPLTVPLVATTTATPSASGSGSGVPKPWWEAGRLGRHSFHQRTVDDPDQEDLEAEAEDQNSTAEEEHGGAGGSEADQRIRQLLLLKGSVCWQHLSDESKTDAYRLRMQKLRDRIPGREIRAGRRHLGAQRGPSFSILTSANEKLSRFLQDPAQSELRLHPMQKSERDQLSHLASLYSLQMLSEGARGLKCPVLKKTCNTMQAVRIDMDRSPSLWTDFKRQKKTPPASVTSEGVLDEAASPFTEEAISSGSNSGFKTGSGTTVGHGRTSPDSPVQAKIRPKYLGLPGHHSPNTAGSTAAEGSRMTDDDSLPGFTTVDSSAIG